MAQESMTLKNINVLSEEQLKGIPEEDIKKDEIYMVPLFDQDGKLIFPNGTTLWIA